MNNKNTKNSSSIQPKLLDQVRAKIHGIQKPDETLDNHEKFLLKFEIPSESKKRLQQMIWDLGIRKSNIFPDLENLEKEMSEVEYNIA